MLDLTKENKQTSTGPVVDFSNTEIAFHNKTDIELRKAALIFGLMNKAWLVDAGSKMGLLALRMRLPFVQSIIKSTIFEQFVGGTTLLECQGTIDKLSESNSLTILDYGAEAKVTKADFNNTMNETIRAIEFAAINDSVPVVSTKISGLASFALLESIQEGVSFNRKTRAEYKNVLKRLDSICYVASEKRVGVFFDAEESWIQDTIDHMVEIMMKRYNRERVIVYNTFQLYRHDRLQFLMDAYSKAKEQGYLLGAKLVRGAYMEKERERASNRGYASPIQESKAATDDAYNMAVRFCVDHYEEIASCNATHNMDSCLLQAELIAKKKIPRDHPHLNFCQLYGMSDQITFNLASAGYNVAKYVPYGQVQEVIPYLIRRAQENSAVTGDMSREYKLIRKEMKRRGMS
ncbi:MAG: proline dehydrogenase family protein [Bacteroidota bacterium]